MTIKPAIAVSLALGAMLTLAACDSSSSGTETATKTPTASTAAATSTYETPIVPTTITVTETTESATPAVSTLAADDSGDYLESHATVDTNIRRAMSSEGIVLAPGIGYGYAQVTCEGLQDGLSFDEVAEAGMYGFPEFDYMDHMFMIGVSIAAVCPDYA